MKRNDAPQMAARENSSTIFMAGLFEWGQGSNRHSFACGNISDNRKTRSTPKKGNAGTLQSVQLSARRKHGSDKPMSNIV
jgi:hypothetical protein